MNVTINISKGSHPKTNFGAARTSLTSTIQREGYDRNITTGLHVNGAITDEIDNALKSLIGSMVSSEETGAVVTITLPEGYTLSAALQQHYADKYTAEPEVTSVVFA